jgi:hypothetical protein
MCGDSSFVIHFLSEIYDFFFWNLFLKGFCILCWSVVFLSIFVDPECKEDTGSTVSIALLAE